MKRTSSTSCRRWETRGDRNQPQKALPLIWDVESDCADARFAQAKPVWRDHWWTAPTQQTVFLRRLSGNDQAFGAADKHRVRAYCRYAGRRLHGSHLCGMQYDWTSDYMIPNDRHSSRGNCTSSDRRQLLNLSTVYETPKFSNGAVRAIAGGWQISGIVRLQSGQYLGITTGVDSALTGMPAQRPNQVLPSPLARSSEGQSLAQSTGLRGACSRHLRQSRHQQHSGSWKRSHRHGLDASDPDS